MRPQSERTQKVTPTMPRRNFPQGMWKVGVLDGIVHPSGNIKLRRNLIIANQNSIVK